MDTKFEKMVVIKSKCSVVTGLRCENPLILNTFELLEVELA